MLKQKQIDWKKICLYAAALLSARIQIAGAWPFVPAMFMTAFIAGVNRSFLFLCTLAGLVLFVPVAALIKYGLAVILAVLLVKILEWYTKNCSCIQAAVISAVSVLAMTLFGAAVHMRLTPGIGVGLLEALFIGGFVHAFGRFGYLFLEWEPFGRAAPQILVGSERKLAGYAESFEKLSRTFDQMNRYKEDFTAEELGRMQNEVTGRVCISCSQKSICWNVDQPEMYPVLYRFIQNLQKGNDTSENTREMQEHCPYCAELVDQALQVFEKARVNMAWYNRLQENREVIAQQLDAMAYIMEDCAKDNRDISRTEGRMLASVRYAFRECGIQVDDLKILERASGKKEILLQGRSRTEHCIPVREIAKIVGRAAGGQFVSAKDNRALIGRESAMYVFEEDSRYTVYHGIARMVKEGEQISGDSFSFLTLDSGRFVMSLSDGMGCGIQANKESELVIDLLEKFLEAGFHPETAIRMMNSAMVTHGENNLFSTVDVMQADLDTGICEFFKVGAAATFIKRGKDSECLDCGEPPVGVFSRMDIRPIRRQLRSGDYIIMVSDGVLDYLNVKDPTGVMAEILASLNTKNAEQLARQILQNILLFTGGQARDDMTVLAAGLWEKET